MDQQRGAALAERDLPLFGLEDALDPLSPPAWTGPFLPDDYCGGYTPTTPYYATTQPLDIFGTLDNIFPSPCPPQQQFLHTDPTLSPAPVTAYNDNQLAVTTSPSLASSFSIDPQQGFAYSYTQRHWTQWPDTTETKSTARLDTAKIQTTSPLNDKSHMRRRQAPAAAHSHTSQKARGRGKHGRATGVPSTPVATFAATPPIAAAHGPWRPLTVGEAGEGEAPEATTSKHGTSPSGSLRTPSATSKKARRAKPLPGATILDVLPVQAKPSPASAVVVDGTLVDVSGDDANGNDFLDEDDADDVGGYNHDENEVDDGGGGYGDADGDVDDNDFTTGPSLPSPFAGATKQAGISLPATSPSLAAQLTHPATLPRSKSRIQNRLAANKCRAKSKAAAALLEVQSRDVRVAHEKLKGTVTELKEEVYHLKEQLFRHVDCGCTLIRDYLSYTAHQIVDDAAKSAREAAAEP